MAYLTFAEFKTRSTMPKEDVDAVEVAANGYTAAQLSEWSSRMDSILRKRYAVPFLTPYPEVILGWLARLVTPRVFLRRGVNPSDAQFEAIVADAAAALSEIKEAANSDTGLFDLPLKETDPASAVVAGGPQSYSETSPYVWTDVQRENAEENHGR